MTYPIGTKLTSRDTTRVYYVVKSDSDFTYFNPNLNPEHQNINSNLVRLTSKIHDKFIVELHKESDKDMPKQDSVLKPAKVDVKPYPLGTIIINKTNGKQFVVSHSDAKFTVYHNGNRIDCKILTLDVPIYFDICLLEPDDESVLHAQEGGDHYKKLGDYQPWEVLKRWMTPEEFHGYMKGTAIAYLARERDKGGALDIKKAIHTLQALIELTGGKND